MVLLRPGEDQGENRDGSTWGGLRWQRDGDGDGSGYEKVRRLQGYEPRAGDGERMKGWMTSCFRLLSRPRSVRKHPDKPYAKQSCQLFSEIFDVLFALSCLTTQPISTR